MPGRDFWRVDAPARTAPWRGSASLHDLAPQYAGNRVHKLMHRVEAQLGRREIEQAAAEGTVALRLAGGIRSGRVSSRLASLRDRFAQWPDLPAVRRWVERCDATIPT
jgi:hypothetical protein